MRRSRRVSAPALPGIVIVLANCGAATDPSPVTVEPVLSYATYLGGQADENDGARGDPTTAAVAVDAAGNTYVTGSTESSDFPTRNAFQGTPGGGPDVFVAKYDGTGQLVYCTLLGGAGIDRGLGIAVDAAGGVYVTGRTQSANFPTAGPLQPVLRGNEDAFVAHLDPTGSSLLYSTYLGGSSGDDAHAIAVDAAGNAVVVGGTTSTDFPVVRAWQAVYGGGRVDAYVARLDPSGSRLVYSTYFGGTQEDHAVGVALDPAGNAYVTGATASPDLLVPGGLRTRLSGPLDGFVLKLDAEGRVGYATYLGGSGNDHGVGISVDALGQAVVAGATDSIDAPLAAAAQASLSGGTDAYVAKLDASGSALLWASYLGGTNTDVATGVALAGSGESFVVGSTRSTALPAHHVLGSSAPGAFSDALIARFSRDGRLVWTATLGGSGEDNGLGIAVTPGGRAHITGATSSPDLPVRSAAQPALGGETDAFVLCVCP